MVVVDVGSVGEVFVGTVAGTSLQPNSEIVNKNKAIHRVILLITTS
jgi:hypothetical protein